MGACLHAARTGRQRQGTVERHGKQRRLNLLPPYPSGLVLITPPQAGVFADTSAACGKLTDHLHPLYRSIMKEYFTDGQGHLSADGKNSFAADEYYRVVAADITATAAEIPLTVAGGVAWVAAASVFAHIRLTLMDGAYINPGDMGAVITFQAVTPVAVTDILTNERIGIGDARTARVPVAPGVSRLLFRDVEFRNVEMENAL